jgi:hypothetical protein
MDDIWGSVLGCIRALFSLPEYGAGGRTIFRTVVTGAGPGTARGPRNSTQHGIGPIMHCDHLFQAKKSGYAHYKCSALRFIGSLTRPRPNFAWPCPLNPLNPTFSPSSQRSISPPHIHISSRLVICLTTQNLPVFALFSSLP